VPCHHQNLDKECQMTNTITPRKAAESVMYFTATVIFFYPRSSHFPQQTVRDQSAYPAIE
jgi:hypothetical protein